jgi:hypothetical protein
MMIHHKCAASPYVRLNLRIGHQFLFGRVVWGGGGGTLSKQIRKSIISFVVFVGPSACNSSAPAERIFMEFDIFLFCHKSLQEIQVSSKSDNKGCCT